MGGQAIRPGPASTRGDGTLALVWIDSREAVIARCSADTVDVEWLTSDVPSHRRSTGHVRHDPAVRHGGGGAPQSAGEERRLEHLARFLEAVEQRLPATADLVVLGPGTVHERLAREIRTRDTEHRVDRVVRCEVAPRMTRRQLIARLRMASGEPLRRRAVGAYRWTDPSSSPGDRANHRLPRRVSPKRSRSCASRSEEVT